MNPEYGWMIKGLKRLKGNRSSKVAKRSTQKYERIKKREKKIK